MNLAPVTVLPDIHEYSLKVPSIPKERVITVFTANGSDEQRNEGMQYSRIKVGLNLDNTRNRHVRLPFIGDAGIVDRCV